MNASTDNLRRWCGIAGLAAGVAALAAGIAWPGAFFPAYLVGALAWRQVALGCILVGLIHRLAGGAWGETLMPFLKAGIRTAPWAFLFSLPLLFGHVYLFPAANSALHPGYLSARGYLIRAIGDGAAILFLRWLLLRDAKPGWSGPVGLIVYVIAAYLFAVDWVMALEPRWASSGFPVIFMASQALCGLAVCIAAGVWQPIAAADPKVWKDLGNLLLALLLFWAYVSYGQFLVVWSSNLPKEAAWYVHRNAGGWHYLIIALAILQLAAPALLLLASGVKRRSARLGWLAAGIGVGQFAYLCWLVWPSFPPGALAPYWLDALPLAAALGCGSYLYLGNLSAA